MRHSPFLLALAVFFLLSACTSASEPEGPRIERVADLLAALNKAGIEVVETAMAPSRPNLASGRVVFLGEARVEIYESESDAAREAAMQELLRRLPADSAPNLWGRGRVIVVYDGLDGPTIALLSGLLGDELNLPASGPVEPYPPAVASAIGWVAQADDVEPGMVVIESYEQVEWPDACLGLSRPDEACAAVITPGWRVTLHAGDETHTLRTDDLGRTIRKE